MEKQNEFLNIIREADKTNKEDEEAYVNRYEEFAQMVQGGNFKVQGEVTHK